MEIDVTSLLGEPVDVRVGEKVYRTDTNISQVCVGRSKRVINTYNASLKLEGEITEDDLAEIYAIVAEMLRCTPEEAAGMGDAACMGIIAFFLQRRDGQITSLASFVTASPSPGLTAAASS